MPDQSLANKIVARVCNEHRNSDIRADNKALLREFDVEFERFREEAGVMRRALETIETWPFEIQGDCVADAKALAREALRRATRQCRYSSSHCALRDCEYCEWRAIS